MDGEVINSEICLGKAPPPPLRFSVDIRGDGLKPVGQRGDGGEVEGGGKGTDTDTGASDRMIFNCPSR